MTTLAQTLVRTYEAGRYTDQPVIAADIIYEGSAVGENGSGYARPLVAGDPFLGFCATDADNSAGAAGDINVRLRTDERIVLPIASLAITDVGKTVYASDDNTFTLTAGANTAIGFVQRWVSTGVGVIDFSVAKSAQAQLAITWTANEPTAGDSATIADGTVPTVAELGQAVADITAKLNLLIQQQGG